MVYRPDRLVNTVPDVVVIGGGISGIAAAQEMHAAGLVVTVVEKNPSVGGRMASATLGDARLDHGAQFFTTRSAAFTGLIGAAVEAGAVAEWCTGFDPEPDGYPRWRGATAMSDLVAWMARDLDVRLDTTVTDLREMPARAYIITAPVPQSLAILSFSDMLPEPGLAAALSAIAYKPTIAVLLSLSASPAGLAAHGGAQFASDPHLAFVTENQNKGISTHPALTIHLSNEYSAELWKMPDVEVVKRAVDLADDRLGIFNTGAAPTPEILDQRVQRWRYAGPVQVWPEATVVFGQDHPVALAGETFAGPKVEGAFLSGLAAAGAIMERLQ